MPEQQFFDSIRERVKASVPPKPTAAELDQLFETDRSETADGHWNFLEKQRRRRDEQQTSSN